jgi:hypothetical protein
MLAPGTRDEVCRLQAELPGYDFVVSCHGHAYRFEAVRRPDGPRAGPWCAVSSDLADLWRELAPWTQPGDRCPHRASPRSLNSARAAFPSLAGGALARPYRQV